MNRSTKNDQSLSDRDGSVTSYGLWLLTGVVLGTLVLLFYYLANSLIFNKSVTLNSDTVGDQASTKTQIAATNGTLPADPKGSSLPLSKGEPISLSIDQSPPRFTFYQELSDPQANSAHRPAQPINTRTSELSNLNISKPLAPESNDKLAPSSAVESEAVSLDNEEDQRFATAANTKPNFETIKETPNETIDKSREVAELDVVTTIESNDHSPSSLEQYVLQTGSFKDQLQADRQRAELLLQGYNANIHAVKLPNGSIWHRVLIGPFDKVRATQLQAQLERQSIDSQLRLKR